MRLEEEYRKCVVLIGNAKLNSDDEINPWGTAFLVDTAPNHKDGKYIVTAHHVISDFLDAPFDIRLNKKDGDARNLHVEDPNWISHPTDNTVDVAVHKIKIPSWADCSFIRQNPTITDKRRVISKNLGPGNRTYTVGLWRFLQGEKRNQPFVYTGHIGLVPEDQKVPLDPWLPTHKRTVLADVYLVEGQQLQGASGSPVFVRRTIGPISLPPAKKLKGYIEGSIWLLGLQSDIWTAKPGEDYDVMPGGSAVVVPRGVSAVVPSIKINEVLDHAKLK